MKEYLASRYGEADAADAGKKKKKKKKKKQVGTLLPLRVPSSPPPLIQAVPRSIPQHVCC